MPVSTVSAAVHIAPVVIKTFVRHKKQRQERKKEGQEAPQDDILFNQAFHIVRAFIDLGTRNTIESLQAFTNTRTPSLYWVAVSPVCIPLSTCNDAADLLIDWSGPEEIKRVVGGERWWQVRGLDGIDAEWIAEREHIGGDDVVHPTHDNAKLSREERDILRMEKLEPVMFYVHGGGYFWGSINTHRHQIVRHAHKLRGRAFAVNYRKAPQYPWPCPVHDVLAAYLYLIRPPPQAIHKPVDPRKIVFAGDSAGGGLCLSVLCILRDLGLPMPAGATLISPWVDLTHSFPSVMGNTKTDIIPNHGFLAKPSVLWPLEALASESKPRVARAETNPPPIPGEADTLKPSPQRIEIDENKLDVPKGNFAVETQEEMLEKYPASPRSYRWPGTSSAPKVGHHASSIDSLPGQSGESSRTNRVDLENLRKDNLTEVQGAAAGSAGHVARDGSIADHWIPKPAKVLMENSSETPLELRSQIQMYATTEQLTHPLVSPITQGSLGNLPPLYILAGDGEVLRDEIVYLAHRAAHPTRYPVRESILQETTRQRENAERFTKPTNVHLQVFDGMCHVVTVFMFNKGARYAYRSIAEFIRHVTESPEDVVLQRPFPEFSWGTDTGTKGFIEKKSGVSTEKKHLEKVTGSKEVRSTSPPQSNDEVEDRPKTSGEVLEGEIRRDSPESDILLQKNQELVRQLLDRSAELEAPSSDGGIMLRERIDLRGVARPMEPVEDMAIFQIPSEHIGLLKEAPTMRWARGQEEWDHRYLKQAQRVVRKREELIKKSEVLIRHALHQGLVHPAYPESVVETPVEKSTGRAVRRRTSIGEIQEDRRWGPLDLKDEKPPGSAIAGRRDTHEALALLRKSIYHTAPVTHQTVPRMKASDAFRATMDPHDDPNRAPRQSVAEQQVERSQIAALSGLRIWEKILGYLGRKSSSKASSKYKSTVAYMQRDLPKNE